MDQVDREPPARKIPIIESRYSSTAGVGVARAFIRASMTPDAHGWRNSMRRADSTRRRMAVFHSVLPAGGSISPTRTSIMPSSSSFLLVTCLYSAMGTTPSACAILRILSASTPPSSARATAVSRTRFLLKGVRDCAAASACLVISTTPSRMGKARSRPPP